jgi:hypothetical protein
VLKYNNKTKFELLNDISITFKSNSRLTIVISAKIKINSSITDLINEIISTQRSEEISDEVKEIYNYEDFNEESMKEYEVKYE